MQEEEDEVPFENVATTSSQPENESEEMQVKRLARIREYQEDAADSFATRTACIEGITGGLLEVSYLVEQRVLRLVKNNPSLSIAEISKATNVLLTTTRQVERNFDLQYRIQEDSTNGQRPPGVGARPLAAVKRLR